MNCRLCGRLLDNENDPLSAGCGEDCAYCMLEKEIRIGDYTTAFDISRGITERIGQYNRKRLLDGHARGAISAVELWELLDRFSLGVVPRPTGIVGYFPL